MNVLTEISAIQNAKILDLYKIKQLTALYFQNPDLPQRDGALIMLSIEMIVTNLIICIS